MAVPPVAGLRTDALQDEAHTAYAGTGELRAIERCLSNYNAAIVGDFARGFGRAPRVLDFGAGIGTLAQAYLARTGIRPECVELDAMQRQAVRDRGFTCHESVRELRAPYDAIYSSNVLEHIPDDVQALRELRGVLRDGGLLALYLPAHAFLYNAIDASVGHCRRYGRRELAAKLELAGFEVRQLHYADCIGFFPWLAIRLLGRARSDALADERGLRFYDRLVFPLSRLLDRLGASHLFGKNVVALAVKRPAR